MRMRFMLLATAALLGSGPGLARTPQWLVSEASGSVMISHAGISGVALRNAVVAPGDMIRTGPKGRAVLVRGQEYVLVAPGSQLRLPAVEQAGMIAQVMQDAGDVIFMIRKMATPHFAVQTPYLAAVVKGTTFSVGVSAAGATVKVLEGAVDVATVDGGAHETIRPGGSVSVGAGQLDAMQVAMNGAVHVMRSGGKGSVTAASPVRPIAAAPPDTISEAPVSLASATGGLVTDYVTPAGAGSSNAPVTAPLAPLSLAANLGTQYAETPQGTVSVARETQQEVVGAVRVALAQESAARDAATRASIRQAEADEALAAQKAAADRQAAADAAAQSAQVAAAKQAAVDAAARDAADAAAAQAQAAAAAASKQAADQEAASSAADQTAAQQKAAADAQLAAQAAAAAAAQQAIAQQQAAQQAAAAQAAAEQAARDAAAQLAAQQGAQQSADQIAAAAAQKAAADQAAILASQQAAAQKAAADAAAQQAAAQAKAATDAAAAQAAAQQSAKDAADALAAANAAAKQAQDAAAKAAQQAADDAKHAQDQAAAAAQAAAQKAAADAAAKAAEAAKKGSDEAQKAAQKAADDAAKAAADAQKHGSNPGPSLPDQASAIAKGVLGIIGGVTPGYGPGGKGG